ncbi:hypothetical protein ACTA71_000184 [Dictyostelium dimigraforme]
MGRKPNPIPWHECPELIAAIKESAQKKEDFQFLFDRIKGERGYKEFLNKYKIDFIKLKSRFELEVKDNAVKNVTVSTPSKKQNIVYSESGSSESEAEVVSKNPFPRKRNNETFNDIGLVSFNYPVDQNDILDLKISKIDRSLPFNFYSISQLIPLPYFIVRTNQAIKVFLQIPTPWGIHFPKISLHQGKEILSNNPDVDSKDFYLCIKYHPRLPQRDQLEEFFTSDEISKLVITAKFLPMQKLPIKLGLEMDDETPNHFVHEIKNGFIVFTINSIQVSDDDF